MNFATMLLATLAAAPAAADVTQAGTDQTVVVVAGPRYAAGPLQRFFLGTDYRRTWTTPVHIPVLDLGAFGGLKPTEKGGGMQTVTLEFEAPDGREFRFRSVDKDPSKTLPEALQDTAAEWVVQDQIRASYPVGSVITDDLAAAAGVLYVAHGVYVMPDDERLGQFRGEFKGMLGILEENPDVDAPLPPGFEGATRIIDTQELNKLLDGDPGQRVDTRAYLRARLFDMLIGDWDRHQDQWEWVTKPGEDAWIPFPKDRDMAFADYDGFALAIARGNHPMLVQFEKEYPRVIGLAWNSREVDRRLLFGLERAAFEETAAELQGKITDDAIARAVNRLPPEYLKLDGGYFHQTLRARRDGLRRLAGKFYELLARETDVHLTDAAEVVEVDRSERDDSIEVRVSHDGGEPTLRRRFDEHDTDEVRIYAKGGDDRLVSQGRGAGGIEVRFIGGPGDDTVDDSRGGRTHFFDHQGNNHILAGPGTKESNKPYERPKDRRGYELVDWGGQTVILPYVSAGGGVGLLAGLQIQWLDFGFRKHPFAARHALRGGYAFGRQGFKFEYENEYQHTNSRKRHGLFARASEVELIRFFGFGNQTSGEGPSPFFRSDQRQYLIQPAFRFGLDKVDLWIGPRAKYLQTNPGTDTLLGTTRPYGVGDFGQVGANMRFSVDGRNRDSMATTGGFFGVEGNYYPKAWDVDEAFGEAHGTASAHLKILHLRVGGKKVWGRYPFHEAAFLGGPDTVRSLRRERYAGDAAVFGNVELRLPLFQFTLLLPVRVGVLGLADVGRVYFEGESSDQWHKGYGGGLWFMVLKPQNSVTITAARDPDGAGADRAWRVYFNAGFAF